MVAIAAHVNVILLVMLRYSHWASVPTPTSHVHINHGRSILRHGNGARQEEGTMIAAREGERSLSLDHHGDIGFVHYQDLR
jgi:hypothetical protein